MKENNYTSHFDREVDIMRKLHKGDKLVIEDFIPTIKEILKVFSQQGHSGTSASAYANTLSSVIKKTLAFKALTPLTGKDSEWNDIDGMGMYQNNRQSSVFKDTKAGHTMYYYNDAITWQGEEDYDTFGGKVEGISSSQAIHKFPFIPKTFYIDVYKDYEISKYPEEEVVEGDTKYVYRIKDHKQVSDMRDYYNQP